MNHCNLTTVASKIRCVGLQEAEIPTTPTRKPASVNYFLQAQRRCFKRAQLQVTTRPRALLRRRLEQLLAQVNYLPAAERDAHTCRLQLGHAHYSAAGWSNC